jgi:transcriptional regulator with XRE-family HTH domain
VSQRRSSPTEGEGDGQQFTPYERRRTELGLRLRQLRRAAGLDQAAMAERLGVTQPRVSKIELGVFTPTTGLLERIADALQLSEEERAEIHDQAAELAVEVHSLRVMSRRGGQRSVQAQVGQRETAASKLWIYQAALVPGLLQTPGYVREMIGLVAPSLTDVDALVAGRVERQRVLYDPGKEFRFLVAESALRARVAPVPVLRGQLDRIVALDGALPNVEVRALPLDIRLQGLAMTSFDVMDDQAEVELQAGEVLIRDPREVQTYRERFEALWGQALAGHDLVAFVRGIDERLAGLQD